MRTGSYDEARVQGIMSKPGRPREGLKAIQEQSLVNRSEVYIHHTLGIKAAAHITF